MDTDDLEERKILEQMKTQDKFKNLGSLHQEDFVSPNEFYSPNKGIHPIRVVQNNLFINIRNHRFLLEVLKKI